MSCAKYIRKSRNAFSQREDELLRTVVEELGETDWNEVAKRMPGRNARQCRDRWRGYLQPTLSVAPWTVNEDQILLTTYAEVGPKWSCIRRAIPQRSEVSIKNRWKTLTRATPPVPQYRMPVAVPYIPPFQHQPFVPEMLMPMQRPTMVMQESKVEPVVKSGSSIDSSPETSAGEREPLSTKQDLEQFFKSLELRKLSNVRR